MASDFATEINEIGEINILKVLKLVIEYRRGGFVLNNERYYIIIEYKVELNWVSIIEGSNQYNYEIPGTNTPIKESFLKFFEQQCKTEKIKLKK